VRERGFAIVGYNEIGSSTATFGVFNKTDTVFRPGRIMQNDDDNTAIVVPDKAASEADQYMASLNKRTAELQGTGLSRWVAFGTAEIEARIARWPEKWGDELQALIYGDFDAPDHDLNYPMLGITVEAGKRTNTIIKTALCVVSVRVKVQEKSLSAVYWTLLLG